jgi:hypothetical protein
MGVPAAFTAAMAAAFMVVDIGAVSMAVDTLAADTGKRRLKKAGKRFTGFSCPLPALRWQNRK